MGKNVNELIARQRELNSKLGDIKDAAAARELTEQEMADEKAMLREYESNKRQISLLNQEAEAARLAPKADNAGKALREFLKDARTGNGKREITLNPVYSSGSVVDAGSDIQTSGAVNLTINDIIPTLNEGLGLPGNLNIVTGVVGNELWPVSIDDVEMEEVGEVEALTAQTLHFNKITPTQNRVGLLVNVSNTAIDNAAFDLLGFVQQKFTVALKKYLAEKLYSQAAWTKNKGPFSGLSAAGTITLNETAYRSILGAVASFCDKGFDPGQVCLIIDAVTEADLKATPKAFGQGGFIIENGKLAGYDYVVSHYINTKLNDAGTALEDTADRYMGIGFFGYEAVQQHGEVRLSIDGTSREVAKANVTAVVMNTNWSLTDLSIYVNGGDPQTVSGTTTYPTQAFALYKFVEESSSAASTQG